MVMKRKRNERKRVIPRRRRIIRRIPRSIVNPMIRCKRSFYAGNWTFGTTPTDSFWRYATYNLNQLPNVTEFTNLFDEYKIAAIKVVFRPAYDSVGAGDSVPVTNVAMPQAFMHYFIDPSTNVVPTGTYASATLNSFLENSGVKTRTLNRPVSVYFKPKVTTKVGSVETAQVSTAGWIRTGTPNVSYNGFHVFLQQNNFSSGNTRVSLDMFVTFYCMFRNLR